VSELHGGCKAITIVTVFFYSCTESLQNSALWFMIHGLEKVPILLNLK